MRKIIFLDIDGVLNTDAHQNQFFTIIHKSNLESARDDLKGALLYSKCKLLEKLIQAHPDAQFVFSSSWRRWTDLETATDAIRKAGCPSFPGFIDSTPVKMSLYGRFNEIRMWMSQQGKTLKDAKIVILDDEDCDQYNAPLKSIHIQTDSELGLTDSDIQTAIELLQ